MGGVEHNVVKRGWILTPSIVVGIVKLVFSTPDDILIFSSLKMDSLSLNEGRQVISKL